MTALTIFCRQRSIILVWLTPVYFRCTYVFTLQRKPLDMIFFSLNNQFVKKVKCFSFFSLGLMRVPFFTGAESFWRMKIESTQKKREEKSRLSGKESGSLVAINATSFEDEAFLFFLQGFRLVRPQHYVLVFFSIGILEVQAKKKANLAYYA